MSVRNILDDAVHDLGPAPDFITPAVKSGKRSVKLARIRTGVISVAATAAVLTPALLIAPWSSSDNTSSAAGSGFTQPLPAATYPVVHVDTKGEKRPKPTKEQEKQQYAFRQNVADTIQKLLPPDTGQVRVLDSGIERYDILTPNGAFPITFRTNIEKQPGARPNPGNKRCADQPIAPGVGATCTDAVLPDGSPVSIISLGYGDNSKGGELHAFIGPTADFKYQDTQVRLMPSGTEDGKQKPILNAEQVLKIATAAEFLKLVDFWSSNPTMDPAYTPEGGAGASMAPKPDGQITGDGTGPVG